MTVLIDTNVILDVLLQRHEFLQASSGVILRALELDWNDFEDAVQYTVGEHIQAEYIITRDPNGYGDSPIPVIQPADFLTLMEQ